jgi:hypothetical protein
LPRAAAAPAAWAVSPRAAAEPTRPASDLVRPDRSFRREEALLYALTRQDFGRRDREAVLALSDPGTPDWQGMFDIARAHAVAPIAAHNLLGCPDVSRRVPAAVLNRFRVAAILNMAREEERARETEEALRILARWNCDGLLLKGAALDRTVYDQPWYVVKNDTDILVRPREAADLRGAVAAVEEIERRLPRVECECLEHHDLSMGSGLRDAFAGMWADARRVEVHGQPAWLMSDEDLLLCACVACCRKRFFRLRSLFDVAETVRRRAGIRWDCFVARAVSWRCGAAVYCALLAAAMTLGCAVPGGVLEQLAPGVRRGVLGWLLRQHWLCSPASLYRELPFGDSRIGPSLVLAYASLAPGLAVSRLRTALRRHGRVEASST